MSAQWRAGRRSAPNVLTVTFSAAHRLAGGKITG